MGKSTERDRTYKKEWENLPFCKNWLSKSKLSDDKAFCKYCKSQIRLRLDAIKSHSITKRHKDLEASRVFQKPVNKVLPPKFQTEELKKRQRELRFALFTSIKTTFRSVDDLCEVLNQEFGVNSVQLHRTKCTALTKKVLGPFFKKELKEDIGDSYYSFMIDESTDISVTKLLAFSIRYYSKRFKTIKETFLCLHDILEADANALFEHLEKVIEDWDLKPENFVGFASDGASVMIGCNHSLQVLAKRKYPNLIHMRCVAHSMDLAAKDAMNWMPGNLEFMIRESYNWFCHSALRQAEYKEILNLVGFENLGDHDDPPDGTDIKFLKLISPSTTRWLVIADCVERILKQYYALSTFFDMVSLNRKNDYNARLLAGMYKNEENRSLMLFLLPFLRELRRITKIFQLKKADNLKIFHELKVFFLDIGKRILKPQIIRENNTSQLCDLSLSTDFCYLSVENVDYGAVFEESITRFNRQKQIELKQRGQKFLQELFKGLQKRLKGSLETVMKIEPFILSNLKVKPLTLSDFKQPFFDTDSVSLTVLEGQARKIQEAIQDHDDTETFWIRLYNSPESGFNEISLGVIKMLTIPVSNAEVERTFSASSYFKNGRRNQMKTDLLESILYCKFGLQWMSKTISSFIPPPEILEFDSKMLYE